MLILPKHVHHGRGYMCVPNDFFYFFLFFFFIVESLKRTMGEEEENKKWLFFSRSRIVGLKKKKKRNLACLESLSFHDTTTARETKKRKIRTFLLQKSRGQFVAFELKPSICHWIFLNKWGNMILNMRNAKYMVKWCQFRNEFHTHTHTHIYTWIRLM